MERENIEWRKGKERREEKNRTSEGSGGAGKDGGKGSQEEEEEGRSITTSNTHLPTILREAKDNTHTRIYKHETTNERPTRVRK